jgi:hypothetical protein
MPFRFKKKLLSKYKLGCVSFCANLLGAGEFTLPTPGILKVAIKSLIH